MLLHDIARGRLLERLYEITCSVTAPIPVHTCMVIAAKLMVRARPFHDGTWYWCPDIFTHSYYLRQTTRISTRGSYFPCIIDMVRCFEIVRVVGRGENPDGHWCFAVRVAS